MKAAEIAAANARRGPDALAAMRALIAPADIRLAGGPTPVPTKLIPADVDACIHVGADILAARPQPDEAGYIVGFDFGTSTSKVVVHQPGAGDPAYALPVPKGLQASEGGIAQEHLWRSLVWFNPNDQRFSLTPSEGAVPIEGFKTGLIQSQANRMCAPGVTYAHAAAAYLAMLCAYIVGHHRQAAPRGFRRTDHYSRFHFGVPVACKEEPGCVEEFQRVLAAAFALVPGAWDLRLIDVRRALQAANASNLTTGETPFVMFEELAAVIAGYRASPDRRYGPHVVVDVGASTLDLATFYLPQESDQQVPVYMTGVELLGADALRFARQHQVSDDLFRAACGEHTKRVWSHTFLKKNASFFPKNGVPKPLLFVGGGRRTDLHGELYSRYPEGLEAPLRTPGPGRNLRCDRKTDFARLLLAWGLSQEEVELPRLVPPSLVEREVREERAWEQNYVSKDVV